MRRFEAIFAPSASGGNIFYLQCKRYEVKMTPKHCSPFRLLILVIKSVSKCFLIRNNSVQFISGFFSGLFKKSAKDTEKEKDIKRPDSVAERPAPSTQQGENLGIYLT